MLNRIGTTVGSRLYLNVSTRLLLAGFHQHLSTSPETAVKRHLDHRNREQQQCELGPDFVYVSKFK